MEEHDRKQTALPLVIFFDFDQTLWPSHHLESFQDWMELAKGIRTCLFTAQQYTPHVYIVTNAQKSWITNQLRERSSLQSMPIQECESLPSMSVGSKQTSFIPAFSAREHYEWTDPTDPSQWKYHMFSRLYLHAASAGHKDGWRSPCQVIGIGDSPSIDRTALWKFSNSYPHSIQWTKSIVLDPYARNEAFLLQLKAITSALPYMISHTGNLDLMYRPFLQTLESMTVSNSRSSATPESRPMEEDTTLPEEDESFDQAFESTFQAVFRGSMSSEHKEQTVDPTSLTGETFQTMIEERMDRKRLIKWNEPSFPQIPDTTIRYLDQFRKKLEPPTWNGWLMPNPVGARISSSYLQPSLYSKTMDLLRLIHKPIKTVASSFQSSFYQSFYQSSAAGVKATT